MESVRTKFERWAKAQKTWAAAGERLGCSGEYVAMLARGDRPRPSTEMAQAIDRVTSADGDRIPWADWFAPPSDIDTATPASTPSADDAA